MAGLDGAMFDEMVSTSTVPFAFHRYLVVYDHDVCYIHKEFISYYKLSLVSRYKGMRVR